MIKHVVDEEIYRNVPFINCGVILSVWPAYTQSLIFQFFKILKLKLASFAPEMWGKLSYFSWRLLVGVESERDCL